MATIPMIDICSKPPNRSKIFLMKKYMKNYYTYLIGQELKFVNS